MLLSAYSKSYGFTFVGPLCILRNVNLRTGWDRHLYTGVCY